MTSHRPPYGSRYSARTLPPSCSIIRCSSATSSGGGPACTAADGSPAEASVGFRRLRAAPGVLGFLGFFSAIGKLRQNSRGGMTPAMVTNPRVLNQLMEGWNDLRYNGAAKKGSQERLARKAR